MTNTAHFIGAFFALLCLVGAFRSGRRRWLVEHLPTSKTNAVSGGLVELKGTAEVEGPPLCSHLTQQPCLHYRWRIEEKWSCLTTEDGKIERDTGWEKVAGGEQMIAFRLKDDQGDILIHPQGAKIEAVVLVDKICGQNDPLYYSKGPAQAIRHTKHERRFHESGIPLHQKLYVVGNARKAVAGGASEIAKDSQAPMFLISAWTEDEVRNRNHGGMVKWIFGGLAVLIAGLLARDFQTLQVISESWPIYMVFIAGYLLMAMLIWELIVHSGRRHLGPPRTIES
jgi:hypothetical protein